jgi:uncharacterized protein YgiM (DUF1202 family)
MSQLQLIVFDKQVGKVAIDPGEIAQVVPTVRDGWTMITLHSGHEHMVHHDFYRVVKIINEARTSSPVSVARAS